MTTEKEHEIVSKAIFKAIANLTLFFAYGYLVEYLIHWIFNFHITYWQSLGLAILCDILFKNKIGD